MYTNRERILDQNTARKKLLIWIVFLHLIKQNYPLISANDFSSSKFSRLQPQHLQGPV
jgi:hypothetical protein